MDKTKDAIDQLEAEQRELVLDSFDHAAAWRLGSALHAQASAGAMPVAIDIRRANGTVLFHVSLPGATADQEHWIAKKAAVAFRFDASSALIAARLAKFGVDASAMGWLDSTVYALGGGAVPIEVAGAGVVAVVTISGLASDEDHALAASALRALRDEVGSPSS